MSPGARISYAASAVADAQRMLLSAVLLLEDAGIEDLDEFLDQFFVEQYGIVDSADSITTLLVALETLADGLQLEADEYGHAEVERRRSAA